MNPLQNRTTDSGDLSTGQSDLNRGAAYGGQTGSLGQQTTGASGLPGMANDVCDPPNIYHSAGAPEAVNYVQDNQRERTYEPLDVQKTVVQHDVERVKPILHQEVHQTRLHEVVHHKVEAPRDLGITEVIHHGDTDPCGNRLPGMKF